MHVVDQARRERVRRELGAADEEVAVGGSFHLPDDVGIEFEADHFEIDPADFWPVHHGGEEVGRVTEAVWSPRLNKNIGYVWVPVELSEPGTKLDVESQHGHLVGTTAAIPFVDPKKQVPAASLA